MHKSSFFLFIFFWWSFLISFTYCEKESEIDTHDFAIVFHFDNPSCGIDSNNNKRKYPLPKYVVESIEQAARFNSDPNTDTNIILLTNAKKCNIIDMMHMM